MPLGKMTLFTTADCRRSPFSRTPVFHNDDQWESGMDDHGKARLTVLLHHRQNLDDDLRARPDQDLTFPATLGVDDIILTPHVSLILLNVAWSEH